MPTNMNDTHDLHDQEQQRDRLMLCCFTSLSTVWNAHNVRSLRVPV